MTKLEFHPVAALFPLLEGAEFDALRDDIAANGQLEPIWMHPDGRILDGRNRYQACVALGIEPRFRQWDGQGSAVQFVVSLNLHRRHLTAGQRATLALEVLPMLEEEARARQEATQFGGGNLSTTGPLTSSQRATAALDLLEDRGKSRDHAAALFQTNGRYVSDAKRLREEAPALFDDVRAGKTSLPYALRKLGADKAGRRTQERAARSPDAPFVPVRLILGDACQLDLPDESVDVIITSPPYNLGRDSWPMGGHGRVERDDGIGYDDHMEDEPYQEWQLAVLEELYRVARPGASLFYNHKTRTRDGMLLHPMTWLCAARGWTLRQEIVWDREVTHNHSATLFWPVDERIYWMTKGKPLLYGGPIGMPSVWRFHGPQPYTWHPAPFPDELPRRCLQAIGGQGLVVLDPFAGSGTTLSVAVGMGHAAIGVDNNADYLERVRREYGW